MDILAIVLIWTALSLAVVLLIAALRHRFDGLRDVTPRKHLLVRLAEAWSRHRHAA